MNLVAIALAAFVAAVPTGQKTGSGPPLGPATHTRAGTMSAADKTKLDALGDVTAAAWDSITGKPTTFPPSAHTHPASEVTGAPYDLMFSLSGKPISNELLAKVKLVRAVTIPSGCTGSQAGAGTNPTAGATLTVKQNGAAVATVAIATDGTATFTCAAPVVLAVGDLLTIYGQAVADATLADVSLTLAGTR